MPENRRNRSAKLAVSQLRVGIDIGGTFTDIVVLRDDGTLLVTKVSSTPSKPAKAVLDGLVELLKAHDLEPAAVSEVVHGTTVGSNCILEHKGARTGLLTTRGFRDVLEIGRIRTPDMFDLTWEKPRPLVMRRLRLEVEERIGADGGVVRPLDEIGVEATAEEFRNAGVESIAVCFINSYRNQVHEQRATAILRSTLPDINVTASYGVLPEMKEYERTSTTVVNAYIQPIMRRYIEELDRGLAAIGIRAPLLVVASNGGVIGAEAIAERPVFAVGSGPAAGVVGAARVGRALGFNDLVAFDKGGTTAKASVVEGGQLTLTSEYEFREGISTPSRFIKAGGYMLKVPAIDIAEVGSGGGSIAWVDSGGLLNVGPESAGADPGPACYGKGGDRPTVTDANVLLGYLNPEALVGGSLKLDRLCAESAIRRHVAEPLGIPPIEAAWGVRRVVNANMARAVRAVTVERGRDPRRFILVAFGGSGPTHAVELAQALDMRRVLVPVLPGVFTAVGMLASDVEHHFVRSVVSRLDQADFNAINCRLTEMADQGRAQLAADGYTGKMAKLRFLADLRYLGQGTELTVPLPGPMVTAADVPALVAAFTAEYKRTYDHSEQDAVEMVNLRLIASGHRADRLTFEKVGAVSFAGCVAGGRRSVYFRRQDNPSEVEVLDREQVRGECLKGPVIIESYDSTVVVPPGCRADCDEIGNILIEIG